MNVFSAVARIGADAEQRYTQGGDSIVSFNGAVDSGFGDKKVTTWIKFSLWGKRGESVLPYLKKGGQVGVSGELANRKWTDKDGQDRYSLEVRLNDVTLLGGKPQEQSQSPQQPAKSKPSMDDLDDSIPF